MHLGDADPRRHLSLGHPLEEPQMKDQTLAGIEAPHRRSQHAPLLEDLVRFLLGAQAVEQLEGLVVLVGSAREDGDRTVRPAALQRLDHFLLAHPCRRCQLGDGRGTAQLHGELLDHPVQTDVQVLKGPRHLDRPALVAEVALDLAQDGRGGIRGELHPSAEIEAIDGLDEPDGADLDEVLHRLAARSEATGQALDQRKVAGDELFAREDVTIVPYAKQELPFREIRQSLPVAARPHRRAAVPVPWIHRLHLRRPLLHLDREGLGTVVQDSVIVQQRIQEHAHIQADTPRGG